MISYAYDIILLLYDVMPRLCMISMTYRMISYCWSYDINDFDSGIGLWYHSQYHVKSPVISSMISYPAIYDINDLWYHTLMISEHKSHNFWYDFIADFNVCTLLRRRAWQRRGADWGLGLHTSYAATPGVALPTSPSSRPATPHRRHGCPVSMAAQLRVVGWKSDTLLDKIQVARNQVVQKQLHEMTATLAIVDQT